MHINIFRLLSKSCLKLLTVWTLTEGWTSLESCCNWFNSGSSDRRGHSSCSGTGRAGFLGGCSNSKNWEYRICDCRVCNCEGGKEKAGQHTAEGHDWLTI